MALTFPLSLPNLADLLPLESASWNLAQQQELSGLGSGEGIAHDLGPPLWEAEVSTGLMEHDDAYAALARLNSLAGSVNSVLSRLSILGFTQISFANAMKNRWIPWSARLPLHSSRNQL